MSSLAAGENMTDAGEVIYELGFTEEQTSELLLGWENKNKTVVRLNRVKTGYANDPTDTNNRVLQVKAGGNSNTSELVAFTVAKAGDDGKAKNFEAGVYKLTYRFYSIPIEGETKKGYPRVNVYLGNSYQDNSQHTDAKLVNANPAGIEVLKTGEWNTYTIYFQIVSGKENTYLSVVIDGQSQVTDGFFDDFCLTKVQHTFSYTKTGTYTKADLSTQKDAYCDGVLHVFRGESEVTSLTREENKITAIYATACDKVTDDKTPSADILHALYKIEGGQKALCWVEVVPVTATNYLSESRSGDVLIAARDITIPAAEEGVSYELKSFAWDAMSNLSPLGTAATLKTEVTTQ